jgi:hypothetical protein
MILTSGMTCADSGYNGANPVCASRPLLRTRKIAPRRRAVFRGRRTCLSAGRQRTKVVQHLRGVVVASVCHYEFIGDTKGLPALVQVSAGCPGIEPSQSRIVWRLYSARISVLYSLGFVGAGAPVFRGSGHYFSGAGTFALFSRNDTSHCGAIVCRKTIRSVVNPPWALQMHCNARF